METTMAGRVAVELVVAERMVAQTGAEWRVAVELATAGSVGVELAVAARQNRQLYSTARDLRKLSRIPNTKESASSCFRRPTRGHIGRTMAALTDVAALDAHMSANSYVEG